MVDIYRPSPLMPAGFGMAPMAGEPLAGGGLNFPVWPRLIDSWDPKRPVIITAGDLEVFASTPDLVIPADHWKITFPRETRTQIMRSR